MNDERFRVMLKQALSPVYQADTETDQAILGKIALMENAPREPRIMQKGTNRMLKLAGIILLFALVCTGTVYAGSRRYNKITITDHAISVGETTNTTPDDLRKADYAVGETLVERKEGTQDDQWSRKDVNTLEELVTTYYFYDDYEKALSDTGLSSVFGEPLESFGNVQYAVSERDGEAVDYWLLAGFKYHNGQVRLFEFTNQDVQEGASEEGAFGLSMILDETENVRNYTAKTGREYTLVDGEGKTYVCLSYDRTAITLIFEDLTEEEISQLLDMVVW